MQKIKKGLILASLPCLIFGLLIFSMVIASDDDQDESSALDTAITMNLSAAVLKYRSTVEKYCRAAGISSYVDVILAIIQVESGGEGADVMQSSESLGQAAGSLTPEASIKQGVKYFANLVKAMKAKGTDLNSVIQSYNYGPAFIDYVASRGKHYSFGIASDFAKEKSGGRKVAYHNSVSDQGWRFAYGNMYYVSLVNQYLATASVHFNNQTVQKIMTEALKYQGRPYVFGGASPTTGFDCSGLTQWCFGKAGIKLPRTAQAQYDATQHLKIKDAKPGDLVFFQGTYATSDYITHVGIYVGKMRMYNAGDPVGYANLNTAYWQAHLVGAGRVRK